MNKGINVAFALLPNVHLIDLAGPVQVFYEANQIQPLYKLQYFGITDTVTSKQGLEFFNLLSADHLSLGKGDFLFVAGIDFEAICNEQLTTGYENFFCWMQATYKEGVNICSVCSGTFVLAEAGLLEGKYCTTHWKCLDYLQHKYPSIKVLKDQLFTRDAQLYTSAGMTTGIDLALSIVAEQQGEEIASQVAKEMVVYLRHGS